MGSSPSSVITELDLVAPRVTGGRIAGCRSGARRSRGGADRGPSPGGWRTPGYDPGEHSGVDARRGRARDAACAVLGGVVAGYGAVEVLHGVDVDVASGQVVALLGANGAGKSTLCAVASGLLTPTQGSVLLNGTDVTSTASDRRDAFGALLVPGGALSPAQRRGEPPGSAAG